MRILIEPGTGLKSPAGIGSYAAELAAALARHAPDHSTSVHRPPTALMRLPAPLARTLHASWLQTGFRRIAARADVAHHVNYRVPTGRPGGAARVVTIHDLAVFAHPETFPTLYARHLRRVIRHAVRRADRVLTVSETMREDIVNRLDVAEERVVALPNGLADRYLETPVPVAPDALPVAGEPFRTEGYLLHVGTVERRKNLETLVRALAEIRRERPLGLVLAGRAGHGARRLRAAVAELGLGEAVRIPGYVPADALIALYDHAAALVAPSLYEGFGRPLVEAMARGCPVVASDIGAHREVGREATALYGPPTDAEALARLVLDLLADPEARKRRRRNGRQRAARFRWSELTSDYLTAYRRALVEKQG